jgi:hypothetical protein
MGHTIWVEARGRALTETGDDSSTMLRLIDQLDGLSTKLQVPKLSGFLDYSALNRAYADFDPEGADEDADEPSLEQKQAQGEWFDSSTGLAAFRALRQHLAEHFDDLGFKPDASTDHWPAQLMDELNSCESIIEQASAQGRQFRLTIVP